MHHPQAILRFSINKLRKYTDKYFLLILSLIVGIISGLAALLLKSGVFYLRGLLIKDDSFDINNILLLLLPAVGIGLTVIFLKFIIRKDGKHDIPSILYAISKKKSRLASHKSFSSITAGLLTAGFGGSIGLESPIISSGSSIGSFFGRYLRMNYKNTTVLLACGAAGAIAAIFNTPIAGVVFAVEVLLIDMTGFTLIPLLIASVSGAVVTKAFYPDAILFNFNIEESFTFTDIPFFIFLGFVAGLVAVYFNKIYIFVIKKYEQLKKIRYRIIIGALSLGLMIFLFPALFGEGFETIKFLLEGKHSELLDNTIFHEYKRTTFVIIVFFLLMIFIKAVAVGTTIGAGGVGGIFAPSLFTGALSGFLFAYIINSLDIGIYLSERNFALVGMAAMLGGVIHAPLTGIFLIAEITSGYELIVPLMIATTISFLTVKSFSWDSVFTKKLSERGELLTHHKDKAVLNFMQLESVTEKDFTVINGKMTLRELTHIIAGSKRNLFPVLNEYNELEGVVSLDDIREIMFDTEAYDKYKVYELMILPPAVINSSDSMKTVIRKFQETRAWNLPVLCDGKYIGFVSKSKMFEVYRKHLIDISDD